MNCPAGKAIEETFDTVKRYPMDAHLLWPAQNILVFSEERLREQDIEVFVVKRIDQTTTGTRTASKSSDDDRGVEDEAHIWRVS